ncbi:tetratricopeptide repeat protein, partial [bacterium]|nr:tetratricopeptide repeat protein [bacterium]
SEEIVSRLIKGQIIYPASTYRIAPNFQTISLLDAFDELKRIVAQREITFKYEEAVFLDILLNVASNEALFVLFENFDLLSEMLKKNYLSLLLKRKEALSLLWLASSLAEKEEELLSLGDYALKKSEEEGVDESISRILYNFGYAFGIREKNSQAIKYYLRSAQIYEDDERTWYNLGVAYQKIGDLKKACQAYKKAAQINPDYYRAYSALGRCALENGEIEEAASCFKKCVDLNPKDIDAYQHLSRLANQANDMEKTLAYHEKAMALIAEEGLQDKPTLEEVSSYEKIKKIDAQDAKAWQDLALFWIGKGKLDKGIPYLKRSVTVDPKDASAWYNLGVAYSRKKDISKEIESYKEALGIDPENERFYFNLGLAFSDKKEIDKEIECYRKILKINPANIDAWHNLSCGYRELGSIEEEKKCLAKANELKELAKK